MQKAWNQKFKYNRIWKNLLPRKKLNFAKIWAGKKFIYYQYALVSILANSCPLPTLKFDKQSCNVSYNVFTLVLKV